MDSSLLLFGALEYSLHADPFRMNDYPRKARKINDLPDDK